MQDAWRYIPPGPNIKPVCGGKLGDFVIALGEVYQALSNLIFGCAGVETKEGVGEIRTVVVGLWREVVGLGLAELPGERGVLIAVMDVERQGGLVVKKL